MPIARFQMPDGRVARFQVPDGTTPEQAQSMMSDYVKQNPTLTAPEQNPDTRSYAERTISNIPESAGNVASGIGQAVIHPVDTFRNLTGILAGALQQITPESMRGNTMLYSKEDEASFNAAKDFYRNRYGSWQKAKDAFEKDPVGVAMDFSMALGTAGKAAKLGGLAKTAGTLEKAAQVTNPAYMAAKGVGKVASPIYKWGAGMSSGSGTEAIGQALKGSKEFTDVMRGNVTEKEVLDNARAALQKMKDARGSEYTSKLQALKSNRQFIPMSDITNDLNKELQKFGVRRTPEGLDFRYSTLAGDPHAVSEVKNVAQIVDDWSKKSATRSTNGLLPSEMDTMKRAINNTYSETGSARALTSRMADSVSGRISKAVPEYSEMMKGYAKATQTIEDIQKSLVGKDASSTDTALRKMMTGMKEDATFRRAMLQELSSSSGQDIAAQVAGLLMKRGFSTRLSSIAIDMAALTHFGGALFNPHLWLALMATSPRVVGEISQAMGKIAKETAMSESATQSAYQAGRLANENTDRRD